MKNLLVEKTSMYPTLIDGDELIIKKTHKYLVGDILIYKNKNNLISHRLISKNSNFFFLKGDNNINLEKISKNRILGKVIFINKKPFKNNIIQKLIAFFSYYQSKLAFIYNGNIIIRLPFKILTNPILYIYNLVFIFRNKIFYNNE